MFTTDRRQRLQQILEEVLGSSAVYFQAPPNTQMVYPAIVYQRDTADTRFAGNQPYTYVKRYQVTVIDRKPTGVIADKVAMLPMCTHQRFFVADGLNHDVFVLYF